MINIETIHQYLKGTLDAEDKKQFEQQLAADAKLRQQLDTERALLEGINRKALAAKAQKGFKSYKTIKALKLAAIAIVSVAVIGAAAYYVVSKQHSPAKYELPETNEDGTKQWADADKNLPTQLFDIDNSHDTVIETDKGIVMSIPANCFSDKNGKPVNDRIQLELREALDAADIMKAGLSTMSGGQLLETGGMFYINARYDDEQLTFNAGKSVLTEVPTDKVKPGMQVFDGRRLPDGSIDWVQPKPLEKFLVPVDITGLNFYPPEYEDSLTAWGYDVSNKAFKDSLYYSFVYNMPAPANEGEFDDNNDDFTEVVHTDSTRIYAPHEVSPTKIKAIWDKKFNNTILATKEFEERLKYIHYSNSNQLLALYVNNLDKRLSYIDSLAMNNSSCLHDAFAGFARRGDGRVKNDDMQVKKLQAYYQKKAEAYAKAIAKTQKAFWDKQAELSNEASQKEMKHADHEANRASKTFAEELDVNLTEVYKQLGLKRPKVDVAPAGTYQALVNTMGWKNIDAYVFDATVKRESTTITYQGKTAQISYEPIALKINGADGYDVTYAYLVPDQLSSYTRMRRDKDRFSEKLNGFMTYDLVCVAYKNDDVYFYKSVDIKPGDLGNIDLTKISKSELEQQLNAMSHGTIRDDVSEDYRYAKFMAKEQKRQKQVSDILVLRTKAEAVIFKSRCGLGNEASAKPATTELR